MDPILVTGAAGFVGARFVEQCNQRGIPVVSVDAPEYFPSEAGGRIEHRGVNFGKIVDRAKLMDWLSKDRPTLRAVVHLGACTDTTELDEEYLRKMNFEYSKSLWFWSSMNRVPMVYASSAATYGGGELGYDDDEAVIPNLKPLNPYGESKRLFDLWALAQEKKGAHPPAWSGFKFFNVYGFGERHKEKMASVILHSYDQIKANSRAKLFQSHKAGIAHGEQKRDFVSVDDVVKVLFFALEKPIPRGIYNLGTGKARTFLDLARAVFATLRIEERIDFVPTPEGLRDRYQYFTEAKMDRLRAQGYTEPFASLEDGVRAYLARLTKA